MPTDNAVAKEKLLNMSSVPSSTKPQSIDYSLNSSRYNQLEIYNYIIEARTPTLEELCNLIPEKPIPKFRATKSRRNILRSERKYPKNWSEISRRTKKKQNYQCQVCGLQCLRSSDDKTELTLSEIAKRTANTHHIDGNTFNNEPDNLFVVCTAHHLAIHRGEKSILQGQLRLFDWSAY